MRQRPTASSSASRSKKMKKLIVGFLLAPLLVHSGLLAAKDQILEKGSYEFLWSFGFNQGLDIEIKNKNRFVATITSYGCVVVDGMISMHVRKIRGRVASRDDGSILFETRNEDFPWFFNVPTFKRSGKELGFKRESAHYDLDLLVNQEKGILVGRKLEPSGSHNEPKRSS